MERPLPGGRKSRCSHIQNKGNGRPKNKSDTGPCAKIKKQMEWINRADSLVAAGTEASERGKDAEMPRRGHRTETPERQREAGLPQRRNGVETPVRRRATGSPE